MNLTEFLLDGSVVDLNDGTLAIGWGERERFEKGGAPSLFYFQDFFLNEKMPWHRHRHQKMVSHAEFKEFLLKPPSSERIHWPFLEPSPFFSSFDSLQDLISNNKLSKGVPYLLHKGKKRVTPSLLCRSLRAAMDASTKYPLHLYGTWQGGRGLLGATPEILFERKGEQLHTVACAGTLLKEKAKAHWDQKLLHEHQIVVEAIEEALQSFGRLQKEKLRPLELKSMIHLLTPMCIMLKDNPAFERIVEALHPTPALGAYPKKEGLKWLRTLNENQPRGFFGAPVGYQEGESIAICYVAIRNMQWEGSTITLGAGCGVVRESEKEVEWQELQSKLGAIKELLQLETEHLPTPF